MRQYIDPKETPAQRTRRYIWGTIISLLYIAFCAWAGWGWLLLLPLLIDSYFTKWINWRWYASSPNPIVRGVGKLIDDVLFAVIGVTFLTTFFFQNFGIPSSSLEKTMLIGDYLCVEKLSYGPRMPMTPLAIPLVHNELLGHKSYSDVPKLGYRRLAGLGKVERNDLVVFNFPAGDTVALAQTNPDYYTLCKMYGREVVHSRKQEFGQIVYRPVDRRDHYVKRCIGLPGETISIKDNQVMIDGKPLDNPRLMQLNYLLQTDGTELTQAVLDELEINYRDLQLVHMDRRDHIQDSILEHDLGFGRLANGGFGRIYHLPLTQDMKRRLEQEPYVKMIQIERLPLDMEGFTYPLDLERGWTRDNYGPLLIPQAGMSIPLTPDNLKLYARCIRAYEGHDLEIALDGTVRIDGVETQEYTFAMDYYFMMGDNRHNSADSRAWGFVPEDHIVGKPAFILASFNDEQSWLGRRIRWSRIFRWITGQ